MVEAIMILAGLLAIAAAWMGLRYQSQVFREVEDPKMVREYLRQRYTIDE